jgi:catechol 2,3-dioxygenase-like lactoylglutathione lyase family enzyme
MSNIPDCDLPVVEIPTCCGPAKSVEGISGTKFHLSLNVSNLEQSVAFFRVLFDAPPAKHYKDYAKFEVDDPALVLALNPSSRSAGGALNHVGLRVNSSERLVAIQRRLELAGIRTEREDGVECCYARQTKFWVPDPDRNLWEIYTLEEDLDHSGFGGEGAGMPPRLDDPVPTVWEHMLTSPMPELIPFRDDELDEVRLEGTLNADVSLQIIRRLLAESVRALKPGGRIIVHGLVSDRQFPGTPALPGLAALVKRIPVEKEVLDELADQGFVALYFERLGDVHCFEAERVTLSDMRLVATKPNVDHSTGHVAMYRGPFSQLEDEHGRVFRRGERVAIDRATWELFRSERFAEHFICFAPQ